MEIKVNMWVSYLALGLLVYLGVGAVITVVKNLLDRLDE